MPLFTVNTHDAILVGANLGRRIGVGVRRGCVRFLDVAPGDARLIEILDFVVCWFHELNSTKNTVSTQGITRDKHSDDATDFQLVEGGLEPTIAHQMVTSVTPISVRVERGQKDAIMASFCFAPGMA